MTAPATHRDAEQAWRAVREAGDIQFAPLPPIKPPQLPSWLQRLGEWLQELFLPIGKALGMSWPTLQYVLIALGILLVMVLLWVILRPLIARLRNKQQTDHEDEWLPDRDAAARLLAEAERLAQEGRYEDAVHLLLQRSVQQIADARPDWLFPASTAREIANFPMLPEKARNAFVVIAERVERSLFALRGLNESDWRVARDAYAEFALAKLPG